MILELYVNKYIHIHIGYVCHRPSHLKLGGGVVGLNSHIPSNFMFASNPCVCFALNTSSHQIRPIKRVSSDWN